MAQDFFRPDLQKKVEKLRRSKKGATVGSYLATPDPNGNTLYLNLSRADTVYVDDRTPVCEIAIGEKVYRFDSLAIIQRVLDMIRGRE
jgi:hypothetical protein